MCPSPSSHVIESNASSFICRRLSWQSIFSLWKRERKRSFRFFFFYLSPSISPLFAKDLPKKRKRKKNLPFFQPCSRPSGTSPSPLLPSPRILPSFLILIYFLIDVALISDNLYSSIDYDRSMEIREKRCLVAICCGVFSCFIGVCLFVWNWMILGGTSW